MNLKANRSLVTRVMRWSARLALGALAVWPLGVRAADLAPPRSKTESATAQRAATTADRPLPPV